MADDGITEFRVRVDQDVLDDVHQRLLSTRWPTVPAGQGWSAGADVEFLRELIHYWVHEFDWSAAERELNSWPQIITRIDGQLLHALHARSPQPNAVPLLMTHGWPGSVVEFLDVIGPLSDPVRYGLDPDIAFHVVCPSLPGYGWSGPVTEPGWSVGRIATAEAELMRRIGYERFLAQGGDWGSFVTMRLAHVAAPRLYGIHLNMIQAGPPDTERMYAGLNSDEQDRVRTFATSWQGREMAYARLQASKPHSVGVGLNDSPAGLAAWVVEKFAGWSDCGGDVLSAISRDRLLANVMTYWVTGTATSAARLYFESAQAGDMGILRRPTAYTSVPTAFALLPKEMYRPPRSWVEQDYNLQQWTEFERGGHFAALEQPSAFVGDVRAFARSLQLS